MKKKLKSFYLIVSSLFICLLHLPFAFGKKTVIRNFPAPLEKKLNKSVDSVSLITSFHSVYDSLHLAASGLNKKAFELARNGFFKMLKQGKVENDSVISIVDFSQPSNNKRFYVVDVKNYKVLFNTLVSHGRNSGKLWAQSFSNKPSSYKSSLGFYITGKPYNGSNGYSLKLSGVENGFNSNALRRAIVMHGAEYVNESYIQEQGYIGRSQGCPAVPVREAAEIINTIKDGSCLFIYSPDKNYSTRSRLAKG